MKALLSVMLLSSMHYLEKRKSSLLWTEERFWREKKNI